MEAPMPAIKVGVREFREQIARFLESDTPVAVTRRGETLGVYIPTPRKSAKTADMTELRAAADRLAALLSNVEEELTVTNDAILAAQSLGVQNSGEEKQTYSGEDHIVAGE
jgi:hypothetical protein